MAVKDQRLQRRTAVALRRGDVFHDVLEHGADVDAVFRGDLRRVERGQPDNVLDLVLDLLRPRRRQVDLVHNGQNLQPGVHGEIGVGQRLRLDALRRVDDQQRALARRQRPRNLIVEVDVTRRVDQVEGVSLAVVGLIAQLDRARLDRDAALALKVHRVEDLLLHLAALDRVAFLEQTVGEGRLSVVDVGDDGKIPDMIQLCHGNSSLLRLRRCRR